MNEDAVGMLRGLATDAIDLKGFRRRGVRGWRFTDELTSRFEFAIEHMRLLVPRLLAVREDVLDPSRRLPLYLNRITQAGEDHLAQLERRAPRVIPPAANDLSAPDRVTLYLPRDAWSALRVLSAVPDPDEWLSGSAISDRIQATFYHEEGEFLASRNLVERRRPELPSRPNAALLYRATSLGRAARLRDARPGSTRVQVRVPGLDLSTRSA